MTAARESLRVDLLTPCYLPEVGRGAERIVAELAAGLAERGHAPRVVTSHPGLPRRDVEDGVEVVRSWRPPAGRLRRRRFEDHLTHVPFSYRALLAGQADVALAVYPTDALAAARWSRRSGRPSVLYYMGIPTHRWLTAARRRPELTFRAARGCDAVVALSETAAEAFHESLGVEARVIPPAVDTHVFSPGGRRAEQPTVVCAAAVDQPQKRVGLLVEAFARVRDSRPGARLVLARPRAPGSADGLAGRPGVELADLDDRAALAAAFREAWVSALPSWGEAFGLVLVESLACGTPVVGSRLGAIPEVVNGDSIGRLFDGDDPQALATALLEGLELAGDPAVAEACRSRAEQFSVERFVDSHLALYAELLGRASG